MPENFKAPKNTPHPYAERMTKLCLSFPCLNLLHRAGRLPGISPWNPAALANTYTVLSHGEQLAVLFVLAVWSCDNFPGVPKFNLFDAMVVWDKDNRAAMLAWVKEPFWP